MTSPIRHLFPFSQSWEKGLGDDGELLPCHLLRGEAAAADDAVVDARFL